VIKLLVKIKEIKYLKYSLSLSQIDKQIYN